MSAPLRTGSEQPVLYLDVDDTLLSMHPKYYPPDKQRPASTWRHYGYAPPGAREFMEWALATFEVRWLSWWCSGHEMEPEKCRRLTEELGLPGGALDRIRSAQFNRGESCLKTNGIAWAEHEAGRPFWWVEDAISERERQVLRTRGALDRWIPCHVTDDPEALRRAHAQLLAATPTRESTDGER